jgi:PKD repeat protein
MSENANLNVLKVVAAFCLAALMGLPTLAGWTTGAPMTRERASHGAVVLQNGKILVAGGCYGWKTLFTTECAVYDPVGGTWSPTGSLSTPRAEFGLVLLNNGKVLAIGGYYKDGSSNDVYLASCELYDPVAGTWSATGSMAVARSVFGTVLLNSGKVLVCGGLNKNPSGTDVYLNGAELYDPGPGTWSTAGSLAQSRSAHTATLLASGKVLAAGGASGFTALASAEEYDPALNTWTVSGGMGTGRAGHTATRLTNGKVLVASGAAGFSTTLTAELYDPTLRTWSATGTLVKDRALHTATLLNNGMVLVTGGQQGFPDLRNPIADCELYDPGSGLWTATDSMSKTREVHTASLLPNGSVLITGGLYYDGTTFFARTSCEIYTPAGAGCSLSCTAVPSASSGAPPLTVNFTATATPSNCSGSPTYAWTFGDGATSTQQSPSHTYSAEGSYPWTMVATVDGVPCSKGGTITVTANCALACTATVPATGTVATPVAFQSTATPTGCSGTPTYAWTFGDGQTSTLQNPSHTYANAGSYNWALTVAVNAVTCTKSGSITISPPCTLTCTASAAPTSGIAPLTVSFQSTATPSDCSGTPAFSWDLGDAVTTTLQNPTHTYVAPGNYNWTLTATVNGVTCQKTGTIVVSPPCTYALSVSSKSFTPAGGSANVSITASGQTSCGSPSLSVSDSWVTATLVSYASNRGKVKISVASNAIATPRSASVFIGNSVFSVTQAGALCKVTAVSPARLTVAASGGEQTVAVTATAGACNWTASPNGAAASWITMLGGSGSGPGAATFMVSPNTTGKKRTGTISVAVSAGKKTITVTQGP